MQRRITKWFVAILAAVALFGTTTGCEEWLTGSHLASLSVGWLARELTMPTMTETLCYQNGEPIDCSEVQP